MMGGGRGGEGGGSGGGGVEGGREGGEGRRREGGEVKRRKWEERCGGRDGTGWVGCGWSEGGKERSSREEGGE